MTSREEIDFEPFVGRWRGSWRTWIEPDALHSDSPIETEFRTILGGKDLVQEYTAEIAGESVEGFALIGSSQEGVTVAWVDTWHTSGLVMVSRGSAAPSGMRVTTNYGAEGETWTWTSEFTVSDGRLVIRHYNEGPSIPRYLGVEAVFERA